MTKHIPVLKNELITGLDLKKGDVVVDCTLGGGGHAIEVVKVLEEKGGGTFIGIDFSKESIDNFKKVVKGFKKVKIELFNKNFAKLEEIIKELGIEKIDKLYADLGFSSDQIEEITFRKDQELDMRLDSEMVVKAKDLLNGLYKKEIEKMFKDYGDVRYAGLLAREIEFYKKTKPFERTTQLNAIVKTVLNNVRKATIVDKELQKIYQALRVAVNSEFVNLEKMLETAVNYLNTLGRIAVISFHSGEDRIVKRVMKTAVKTNDYNWIGELVLPTSSEVSKNTRSRSSKMRILGKL
ncbi:16S rRNA (cytosine(1402)-N(4))-methyltransferase RsmH [Candidatus Dojkabacteria bacterium]|nr:16S rRNA (cytosine(1402)-N(4))-methyltransferase RsmH [Candidatus Dojkabacteria bacterium]